MSHCFQLHSDIEALKLRLREINSLRAAASLMYWDQATYLPERAAESRANHLMHIEKFAHELATSIELGRLLESLVKTERDLDPDSNDACLIRVTRQDFERNTRIPSDFLARMSAHGSRCYERWKKARAADDFSIVAGDLAVSVELSRKLSEYLSTPNRKQGHNSILDPLIDSSDPGFTVETIQPLFNELRSRLLPLIEKVTSREPFDSACLRGHFPESQQIQFGENLIRTLGYDFSRGRQDKTHHPFMVRFASHDVRITTRVKEHDLSEALFSTIHEVGHALYELGIAEELDGTPLGRGASSGIHESQSRLWENIVARSLPFWERHYPDLQLAFPCQLSNVGLRDFYRAINRVERSLIRTDADELTYNLHVMIRFDFELDLLEGRLNANDLPEAWNARYESDLGVKPSSLSEGCLQDVHWFHGRVGGEFQGYTIGNILSGQLFAAASREIPDLDSQIREGSFAPLRNWLQIHLHRHGRKYEGPDLIQRATGCPLTIEPYLNYLEIKYSRLLKD